jgi:bacillithiol biosynthesis cysteine-adding enzyme BshC
MHDSVRRERSEKTRRRVEDVPFAKIPGQTKLFLDHLADPVSLERYYPSAVSGIADLVTRKDEVIANYSTDRAAICDILCDQNETFGISDKTAANIARLRERDCVAVFTGQQVGLFTGPLYTIYKALTAVRFAEDLGSRGVKCVPVFWMATEDHDLEEVSAAYSIDSGGEMCEARFDAGSDDHGKPVGSIEFDSNIGTLIDEWVSDFPQTEFTAELRELISETYQAGSTFGGAFGKLLAKLFGKYGLIIFDPIDGRAKQLAAPIFAKAIERSNEIVEALITRSDQLTADGYHAQVLVEKNYFPLFWQDDDGKRVSIKRSGDSFRISGSKDDVSLEFLLDTAKRRASRLSPGVMLRPAVQDFLFPTICYLGGGAEIAYFAQNSEVYRILERPATPIFHRQSFTVVEPRHTRTLEKYGIGFTDLFVGLEKLLPEIILRVLDPETPRVFADAEEKINTELNRLDRELSKIDPTLAESLAKRRRKIIYHIGALYKKYGNTRLRKDEVANRRLNALFISLFPHRGLQERTLNFAAFANRFGMQFLDWMYDATDVENKDHRVVYF